jgi:hypothetical protein
LAILAAIRRASSLPSNFNRRAAAGLAFIIDVARCGREGVLTTFKW